MRRRKLYVISVDSKKGNARSKPAERGTVTNPCSTLAGTSKIDQDFPDPLTNHMQDLS